VPQVVHLQVETVSKRLAAIQEALQLPEDAASLQQPGVLCVWQQMEQCINVFNQSTTLLLLMCRWFICRLRPSASALLR
jgi:hypothetical protein